MSECYNDVQLMLPNLSVAGPATKQMSEVAQMPREPFCKAGVLVV